MTSRDWSFVEVCDIVAAAVPDRDMLVCGSVRRTFGEVQARSRSLASFLLARRVGLHAERDGLERWESGQDAVALLLHNSTEYIEAMFGAYRARAVPFNVNQHYRPAEVRSLLEELDTRAVVYHRAYAPLVAAACDAGTVVLVDVDDGSGTAPLPGSTPYEEATAFTVADPLPPPSPDDLYMVCTGGTTGRPKAVLWRQADVYVSGMNASEDTTEESILGAVANGGARWFAVPPLMHAAAQWTAYAALLSGGTVVVHDDSIAFDAATILRTAERESVQLMSIVGDAYAGPIVEELGRGTYDLSGLAILATGGAATGEHHKQALFEHLPHLMIIDGYGASETGGMAMGPRTKGQTGEGFDPRPGAVVVSEDLTRVLEPGDDEIGWTARRGRVPLGYLGDPDRTRATFPIVDGERMAVPGDRAQLLATGAIRMLGRDSLVVNTGGEKVFVEEVEAVLRQHEAVADAVVVGRPSERFGQEVVAVVALRPGASTSPGELREHVAGEIARFKAPRAVTVCDHVQRHVNGKADYEWAREMAASAVDASTG